jgi:transposase InsO family protein
MRMLNYPIFLSGFVRTITKWPEIVATKHTHLSSTSRIHRDTVARFGLPVTMVSDNGPQFQSNEMEQFTKNNGIQHKFTVPYHPATNGQAECFFQMLKKGLRCMQNEQSDLNMKLNRILMQ